MRKPSRSARSLRVSVEKGAQAVRSRNALVVFCGLTVLNLVFLVLSRHPSEESSGAKPPEAPFKVEESQKTWHVPPDLSLLEIATDSLSRLPLEFKGSAVDLYFSFESLAGQVRTELVYKSVLVHEANAEENKVVILVPRHDVPHVMSLGELGTYRLSMTAETDQTPEGETPLRNRPWVVSLLRLDELEIIQ